MKLWVWLLIFAVVSGCAHQPGIGPSNKPDMKAPEQPLHYSTGVIAADRLLAEGERLRLSGQPDQAVGYFERGIRMAPRSPVLYLALAKTRLEMGDLRNAQQMAQRAVSLSPAQGNRLEQQARAEAWMVIAEVKGQLGDQAGAELARKKATGG